MTLHEVHRLRSQNGQGLKQRKRYGSYKASVSLRALMAAEKAERTGCSNKEAGSLHCVNPAYVGLVRGLGYDSREKVRTGELTLARICKAYRQNLAERRKQRRLAELELEAQVKAERKAEQERVRVVSEAAACRPWDWTAAETPTSNGNFHLYLVDANGRKIGVIWGKAEEKEATADLIIAAVNATVLADPPQAA
jgi:hypothetical protein